MEDDEGWEGSLSLAGAGGNGSWEASLMDLWQVVMPEPGQMAKSVLDAMGAMAAAWSLVPVAESQPGEQSAEDAAEGKLLLKAVLVVCR